MKSKNLFTIIALSTFLLVNSFEAFATEGMIRSFTMVKINTNGNNVPDTPVGNRSNRRPITGEITATGVTIPEIETSEILSYEIYDPSEICIGMYADEMDFIEALFSLSGEYEIRFMTDYAVFAGMIEI